MPGSGVRLAASIPKVASLLEASDPPVQVAVDALDRPVPAVDRVRVLDLRARRGARHREAGHRVVALVRRRERDRLGASAREERRRRDDVRRGSADEERARYRPRWRAMTIRCTSFVPSPISRIFWSR